MTGNRLCAKKDISASRQSSESRAEAGIQAGNWPTHSTGGTITSSRHSSADGKSRAKFYQNENGQRWWLCCHEDAEAFILFEDKPSERRIELQMRDFFDSERSRPAQQARLKLIGSLAVFQA